MGATYNRAKRQIITDTLRRYPEVPTQTLATYIIEEYGPQFNNDRDAVRTQLRYYRGSLGKVNREKAESAGSLIPHVESQPKSISLIKRNYKLEPGKWLILSDIHVPFHQPEAVEAALDYGLKQGITGVLLNGDIQDCAAVGYWATRKRDWVQEVDIMCDWLDWLRGKVGDMPIIYKPGNHEERLEKYYMSHAAELVRSPQANLETVLDLERRGIEYLQTRQKVQAGHLMVVHGHEMGRGSQPVNTARWLFLRAKANTLCGHSHKQSTYEARNIKDEVIATWSTGCLCDLHPDYDENNEWTHGFAILHLDSKGMFEVQLKKVLPDWTVA